MAAWTADGRLALPRADGTFVDPEARTWLEGWNDARQASGEGEWHLSSDGAWCWKGDTSSDEYVGHVFGLSLYHDLVADEGERARIRDAFVKLHDGIMAAGYVVAKFGGTSVSDGRGWDVIARHTDTLTLTG